MKHAPVIAALGALALLASCQPKFDWPWLKDDAKTTEASAPHQLTFGTFDTIRFEGVGQLVLDTALTEGSLSITGPDADKASGFLDGRTLVLKTKDGVTKHAEDLVFRLNPGPALAKLVLQGAGTITSAQPWQGDHLALQLDGVGQIELDLKVGALTIGQHGAGQIKVSGTADSIDIVASGLGQVDAEALVAAKGTVKSSGVGEVRLDATSSLTIDASGVGAVHYKGNPASKTIHSSGITTVDALE